LGDRSALAIIYVLRSLGHEVLVPFGENTRYDLAIDDGARLARVQCKTGRLRDGCIVFKTSSACAHHPNPRVTKRDYHGEVEFFAVFCPETGGVYLIPIEDLPTHCEARLRIEPPRNAQKRRIRHAAQYEIARLPVAARAELAARAGGSGSCA